MQRNAPPIVDSQASASAASLPSPAPPPSSRRRSLLRGSAWGILQNGSRMAIGLFSVPLTIGYLGKDRYGLWMTALSINAFVTFLDVGLTPTLMNRLAAAHGTNDRALFARYASGGFTLGLLLLLVGLVFIAGAALPDWSAWLKITDPLARAEAGPVIVVILALSFAQLALGCIDSIFNARLELSKPRFWATLGNVASFLLLVLAIRLRVSLPVLAGVFASSGVLYRLPLVAELMWRKPNLLKPRFKEFPPLARELLPMSVYFMGIQASFVAFSAIPNVLIARALSLAEVATFSVVNRVMSIPLLVIAALQQVFWPAFAGAWARGEKSWLRHHLVYLVIGTAFGILLFDIGIALSGKAFIHWWTKGQSNVDQPVLYALGAWLLIQSIVYWLSTFLHSISDFRFELISYASAATLLALFGLLLLPHLALLGISLAMVFSVLIGYLIPMWFRVNHKLPVSTEPKGSTR